MRREVSYLYIVFGIFSLIIFGIISLAVIAENEWIDIADLMVIDIIQSNITETKTMIVSLLTEAGNIRFIIAMTIAIVIFLFVKRSYIAGLWFGGTVLFCAVVGTHIIKKVMDRTRPDILPLMVKTTESFPSGHATAATIFYGLLAIGLILTMRESWKKLVVRCTAFLFIGFILLSRIYLGVHFPTDVIAGFLYGMASILISFGMYQLLHQSIHEVMLKCNLQDESMMLNRRLLKKDS